MNLRHLLFATKYSKYKALPIASSSVLSTPFMSRMLKLHQFLSLRSRVPALSFSFTPVDIKRRSRNMSPLFNLYVRLCCINRSKTLNNVPCFTRFPALIVSSFKAGLLFCNLSTAIDVVFQSGCMPAANCTILPSCVPICSNHDFACQLCQRCSEHTLNRSQQKLWWSTTVWAQLLPILCPSWIPHCCLHQHSARYLVCS